jgi:hypothetical protein
MVAEIGAIVAARAGHRPQGGRTRWMLSTVLIPVPVPVPVPDPGRAAAPSEDHGDLS